MINPFCRVQNSGKDENAKDKKKKKIYFGLGFVSCCFVFFVVFLMRYLNGLEFTQHKNGVVVVHLKAHFKTVL